MSSKIHTLRVFVSGFDCKLYAVAQAASEKGTVPLASVNLKFISNFNVELSSAYENLPSSWKEITVEELGRLVRFIKPTLEQRHPLRYDDESRNTLHIPYCKQNISIILLSMRMPVDSIDLWFDHDAEAKEFFQSAGPIYSITCFAPRDLQPSTVDVLIDKFIPVDGGKFDVYNQVTRAQLERLIVKCGMADKKVTVNVLLDDCMKGSELKDLFDFDKYYPNRKVKHREIYAFGEGAKMKLRVTRLSDSEIECKWMEKCWQQEKVRKWNRSRIALY
uniref:DUF4365 domain-containing protein n=1 Tax=Steinernema glaseri TaxID=37863 RepID=A0A1I7ZBV7_9BILA